MTIDSSFSPGYFEVTPLRNSNIQYLASRQGEIDMNPNYQRQSAIWSREKQQLLIDSLINGFDVPTIYLHQYLSPRREGSQLIRWALVDGKQRLDAIFSFMSGGFALSEGFVRISDGSTAAAGKTINDLTNDDPLLVSDLQSTVLDVKTIRTDDVELIEEMFSRLNEAVPLNAAEKRNAAGGPLPKTVREMVKRDFFVQRLPFSNKRYRQFDLAAKFLFLAASGRPAGVSEHSFARDLKKAKLDNFFKTYKGIEDKDPNRSASEVAEMVTVCEEHLATLEQTFINSDELLRSVGMSTVYYLLAMHRGARKLAYPQRTLLKEFETARRTEVSKLEADMDYADYVFLEFARLSQSPNDQAALHYRTKILDTWLTAREEGREFAAARAAVAKLYEWEDRSE